MFAHAIYITDYGRCGPFDRGDLRAFGRAMSGRWGGSYGPEEGYGGHRGPGGGHRGGHRHGGGGPRGGFGGPRGGFGGPGFGFGGGPFGRGRKARRGDIRTAALLLLAEEPRNGYQIMQAVQERSDGVWRPSPGSVYPALAQLEDEGLIASEEFAGGARSGTGRVFQITDAGRAHLQERGEDRPAPWEQMSGDLSDQAFELGKLMRAVGGAFGQVMRTGSEAQIAAARKVLVATRRDLYRILADGDPEDADHDQENQ